MRTGTLLRPKRLIFLAIRIENRLSLSNHLPRSPSYVGTVASRDPKARDQSVAARDPKDSSAWTSKPDSGIGMDKIENADEDLDALLDDALEDFDEVLPRGLTTEQETTTSTCKTNNCKIPAGLGFDPLGKPAKVKGKTGRYVFRTGALMWDFEGSWRIFMHTNQFSPFFSTQGFEELTLILQYNCN